MYAIIDPILQHPAQSQEYFFNKLVNDNETAENKEPIPSVPMYFYLSYTVVLCVVFEF